MVIAPASRSNKRGLKGKLAGGLRARRGSNPFPGANCFNILKVFYHRGFAPIFSLNSCEFISEAVLVMGLFESIMVHLLNRVNARALALIFFRALKLSNISVCLRFLAIREAASSGVTSKKNILFDFGTTNAKKL